MSLPSRKKTGKPAPGPGPAPADSRTLNEANTLPPSSAPAPALGDIPAPLADHPRYRVLGLLGSGGMGAVYRAEHRLMQRPVALKVINQSLTNSPGAVERFQREVVAAARLAHPNIVAAYDAEQAGDLHFLAMELVDGMSLSQLLERRGRLPVAEACEYVCQAALGLQHAHERGMVHRDIKPHNLMLTPAGQVKILDFGLARFVSETSQTGALTQVGSSMGTPDYIAPEQARDAHAADIRADIYSLGCTLYSFLTGQRPFPEGDYLQKLMAHIERTPRPIAGFRNDVPPEVCRIVERMMAKDPARRLQTPAEVAAALAPFAKPAPAREIERTVSGTPSRATLPPVPTAGRGAPPRRRRPWLVALLALLLLVAASVVAGTVACRYLGAGGGAVSVVPEAPKPPEVTHVPPVAPPERPLAWPAEALGQSKVRAPDLGKVKPLLRYDFSHRDSGWPVGVHPRIAVERGYANGTYFLKATKRLSFFEGRGDHFSEFACELAGRVKGPGPLISWGLHLGNGAHGEQRRTLILRIGRDGLHIAPGKGDGEEVDMPAAEAVAHPAIWPAEEVNRLLVVLRGRQLEVYVNGVAVCDPILVPADLSPAFVALFAQFGPRGGEVDFERLTVWPADGLPTPEARGAVAK
jgi:hypothetical protein